MTTMSDRERRCLRVLAARYNSEAKNCLYFRTVAKRTGLTETQARRSVRALARKGLAKYVRGLFDEDSNLVGSGYCCTDAGAAALKE